MESWPKRSRPSRNELLEIKGRPNVLFVTVAAKVRKPIFSNQAVHQALLDGWGKADFWQVGFYLIMPDHLHFFCRPNTFPPRPLRPWIKYWKRLVSQSGVLPKASGIWMEDCWDTQIRNGNHYSQKWSYVRENPVRAGLVKNPDDWPWQGKLTRLEWHD